MHSLYNDSDVESSNYRYLYVKKDLNFMSWHRRLATGGGLLVKLIRKSNN